MEREDSELSWQEQGTASHYWLFHVYDTQVGLSKTATLIATGKTEDPAYLAVSLNSNT